MARAAGARQQDRPVGDLRAAGPDLLAGDLPAVAVALGPALQTGEVGSGTGLGEELAPDLLAGQNRLKKALFLLVAAVVDDRRPGEALADAVDPVGRPGAIELLGEDRLFGDVGAASAVFGRPGEAGVSGLVQLALPNTKEAESLLEIDRFGPRQRRERALQPVANFGAKICLR
ncbi:MAG: hypothetical protein WAO61_01495 [Solirubrobacterales bacterium]